MRKKSKTLREELLDARIATRILEEELQEYLLAVFAKLAEAPAGWRVSYGDSDAFMMNQIGTIVCDTLQGRIAFTESISLHDLEDLVYFAETYYKNK